MQRYPRLSGQHPWLFEPLFNPISVAGPAPASVDVEVPNGTVSLYFCYIAQLAAHARPEQRAALAQAAHTYLLVDGDAVAFLGVIRGALAVTVNISEEITCHATRRAGTDKTLEFVRRLDAYSSPTPLSQRHLAAVDAALQELGYPSREGAAALPLLKEGFRLGTSAPMLAKAIQKVPDQAIRCECNANFEGLAAQIWGWRYPRLDPGRRSKVMAAFNALQAELGRSGGGKSQGDAGCHNVTIRMLWHFCEAGMPCSIEMFRLPAGDDSWRKNLQLINAPQRWRPPAAHIKWPIPGTTASLAATPFLASSS